MEEQHQGPAPSSWELMRAITDLKVAINAQSTAMQTNYVLNAVFIPYQKVVEERFADMGKDVAELRTENELLKKTDAENETNRRDAASTRRLMWTTIVATPIVTLVLNWLLNGGLHSLGG